MKAESDSGLLFFPSSLEMGKEGDGVFLVDQKAQPSRYKGSIVYAGEGPDLGWGEQGADPAGQEQLGWGKGVSRP